jgi:hypothetical protein
MSRNNRNIVTEAELALAKKAGFEEMGSAPIWPTTRGNLLAYIRGQRKALTICSKQWRSDIEWSITSARLCLARLRAAR